MKRILYLGTGIHLQYIESSNIYKGFNWPRLIFRRLNSFTSSLLLLGITYVYM